MSRFQSRFFQPQFPRAGLTGAARFSQKIVPKRLQYRAIAMGLNHGFSRPLQRGDLDFLQQKFVRITVSDIALDFCVTVSDQMIAVTDGQHEPDVTFRSQLLSLVQIAAGKVDPDTLFFRRKLAIEGDTELGLALKNFLDSQDAEQILPPALFRLINHAAST